MARLWTFARCIAHVYRFFARKFLFSPHYTRYDNNIRLFSPRFRLEFKSAWTDRLPFRGREERLILFNFIDSKFLAKEFVEFGEPWRIYKIIGRVVRRGSSVLRYFYLEIMLSKNRFKYDEEDWKEKKEKKRKKKEKKRLAGKGKKRKENAINRWADYTNRLRRDPFARIYQAFVISFFNLSSIFSTIVSRSFDTRIENFSSSLGLFIDCFFNCELVYSFFNLFSPWLKCLISRVTFF